MIIGPNGAGKSALAAILAGEGEIKIGRITGRPDNVQLVSSKSERDLIERERVRDDSDLTDEVFTGTTVDELLKETSNDEQTLQELIRVFKFESLLDRGFRSLSTGETRKLLLMRALAGKPELLILDEPFDGLDSQSVAMLKKLLASLAGELSMVFVMNRVEEIPAYVSHMIFMESARILHIVDCQDEPSVSRLRQLLHLKVTDLSLPEADPGGRVETLDPAKPLVRMSDVRIAYGRNTIFEHLNWIVRPGEHWQVTGPNGSGKTCLLNLITGDHPQCYVNDIFVFGYQRGEGETIWDIKQHIGYVSTALQWEYRVTISLHNVIISGFFDSIGLYQAASDIQKKIALDWLELLGFADKADQPFNQQSYGDQRLLLIARAMVKHPHMLILDEPCLGLDDINRQLILALVELICSSRETTVIYVNHHAEDRIQGIENYLSLA